MLAAVATIAWLLVLASVVDDVVLDDADLAEVRPRLVALVALLALRSLCTWAVEPLADRASGRLRTSVRSALIDHVLAAGPAGLSGERSGEIAAAVGAGVESLHDYVTRFVPAAALAVITPLLVGATVLALDPWTTLILLFTGPMLVLLLAVIGGGTRASTQRRVAELGWLSAFYLDMVRGLATLKAFGRAEQGADTIERVSRRYGDTTMEVLRTAFQTSLVMEWAATAATALAAVQISFRMIDAGLPFGTGLAVLVLVPEFFVPFRRMALEYHAGQSGRAALANIDRLMALPTVGPPTVGPPIVADPAATAPPPLRRAPRLELRAVTHQHLGATAPALRSVDLELEAGTTVALVGPSGAGKSTLANLLLRFTDPTEGSVLVDGHPLVARDPREWRRSVAWVPQDPTIVAGTVADNIRLGDPEASEERVRAAARTARADRFIVALPDGYDTVLGERGLRLSAGQRQRLAIARAVLRDAPVVVLDEFTAHLDDATEAELLEGIRSLLRGRTALLIAHRAATAALAPRVVRLEDGRIVARGGPELLVADEHAKEAAP